MGMLFGDTSGIDEEVYDDFRKNGTAHVLAVSGLHIGLLYSIYEKLTGGRTHAAGTVILAFMMYSYGTLSLWSPSVLRAEIMIGMKTAARISGLRYDSLTAMSAAAVFLMVRNPYVIYGIGFQMSFLAILSIDTVKKIHEKLPYTHLVMHGSSSVPQDLQDIINAHGGQMPQTYGVPVEEIQEAIKHGVRKVNVDTDLRMALTGAIRKCFMENPAEFDPRKYLKPAIEAMKKVCMARYTEFGAAGQAGHIKPVPLAKMASRYKSRELAPEIN